MDEAGLSALKGKDRGRTGFHLYTREMLSYTFNLKTEILVTSFNEEQGVGYEYIWQMY